MVSWIRWIRKGRVVATACLELTKDLQPFLAKPSSQSMLLKPQIHVFGCQPHSWLVETCWNLIWIAHGCLKNHVFHVFLCFQWHESLFVPRCSLHQSRVTPASVQVDRKVLEEAFVRFGELKTATWVPKYKLGWVFWDIVKIHHDPMNRGPKYVYIH